MRIPGGLRMLALMGGVALLSATSSAQMQRIDSGSVMAAVDRLEPGQFIWAPQIAPEGPMLVVVNIATQRLVAYRNGVPFAVSTASTGRAGHPTPTGVFPILQKRVRHYSSTYDNAPMPYMQRLTWRGVALHGGALPGYPASHGCIRLPHEFAKLLFGETGVGMTVVIVNQPAMMRVAPTVPQLQEARGPDPVVAPIRWQPELAPAGPVSIVVSAADRRMLVLRNGVEIGSAPVSFEGTVDRVQAYTLRSIDDGRYKWLRVPMADEAGSGGSGVTMDGQYFDGPLAFREALTAVVKPGTSMVVIPDSLGFGGTGGGPAPLTIFDNAPAEATATR